MTEAAAPRYKSQDSSQTLEEALDEFYARNPQAIRATGDSLKDEFFRSHDTIHVVFGCDTTIRDEVLTDFWTIFGSDLGFRNYLKYLGPLQDDLQDIFKDIGWGQAVWKSLKAMPRVPIVFWRARKMRGKWQWRGHDRFLKRPLKDLRQELNIRVIA